MDNSDQQNPTSTPLDITPTSETPVTETTVTETSAPTPVVSIPVASPAPITPPTTTVPVNISVNTPAPATPVVITPVPTPEPVTPVVQETMTTTLPTESTIIETPAPPSVSAPVTTPMGTAISTTPVVQETTTVTEEPLAPKKKEASPLVLGLAAVLFLGVAGIGVFAVSRATQQAAVPTAPVSEPAAFESTESAVLPTPITAPVEQNGFNPNEEIDCSGEPNTAPYGNKCLPTFTDESGNVYWAPQSGL